MPADGPSDKRLLPDLAALIARFGVAPTVDAATVDAVKLHAFDALGCTWAGAETIGNRRHA